MAFGNTPSVGDSAVSEFIVSAGLVYEIVAAACSSPQTAEINAAARSDTLMKWVKLGVAQAGLFIGLSVLIQVLRGRPWWPVVAGAGLAIALLYCQYVHALRAGLEAAAQGAPATETY